MRIRCSIARPGVGVLMAVAMIVAACGGAAVPPPATVAAPTMAPQITAPTIAPTAAPSVAAPPSADLTPVPGGGGGAGGGEPRGGVVAINIAFEPPALSVPANEAFILALHNEDPGIPHTLQVNDPNGSAIATTDVITGPGEGRLQVPALEPGTYMLVCTIHPTMTATLTVD